MLRALVWLFGLLTLGVVAAVAVVAYIFYEYGRDLPEYRQLADYEPPVATRVYAGDGRLMAEYAIQQRVFVPIEAIPQRVIDAFLAAEDQHFYEHRGVDPLGVVRAAIVNLRNLGEDRRMQGASTITQQVAKNFLLTNEVSIERKIKEAILAFRIEEALSKERILELYLNEIYLGYGAYGVAAAALAYFDKPLDELTIAEAAYLAALPKAPNNYHPINRTAEAKTRRDWVIARMFADGLITRAEAAAAQSEPLEVHPREAADIAVADYATEDIRRQIVELYGTDALYEGGLYVRSTIDPWLQDIARTVLRDGLAEYDRRHGWRGPFDTMELGDDWAERLAAYEEPEALAPWFKGVVLEADSAGATIGLADGTTGYIPSSYLTWARRVQEDGSLGPAVSRASDVLNTGDIIGVRDYDAPDDWNGGDDVRFLAMRQIPEVGGAIIALDPHTGRILAMEGGFSYADSEFNRATQALRQPGSAFKPFVYMAALDNGFTPASLVEDAPIVFAQGEGLPDWRPANYTQEFYGLSTLRLGLEKSRNLMTVRLANQLGMDVIADYASRFGVIEDLPPYLPMALGAGETTLLQMTTAYGMIVNGGMRIEPSLIERIQDRNGLTIWQRDERTCLVCQADVWHEGAEIPRLPDLREQVVEATTAYQMVSLLEGVVLRGTGARISTIGKPLGGKTGTTNEYRDAWFVGFSPDLVVGVYVGFDQPESLGPREAGSAVAGPIFKAFMEAALAETPGIPFRIPPGLELVRIDADNGLLPGAGTSRVLVEAFKYGTSPTSSEHADSLDASGLY
ncbi:MAG: penicillin-binding protein 1A [Pseudomonadota bacterium]